VRLSAEVRPGVVILDEKRKRLGRVTELIGPVKAPYASIATAAGARVGRPGDAVFVER